MITSFWLLLLPATPRAATLLLGVKKTHIAERVAGKLGIPADKAANQVDVLVETLMKKLRRKSAVQVKGFGTVLSPSRDEKKHV